MNTLVHIWGAYAFIFIYLCSVLLGIVALIKKSDQLERWAAWGFVFSFVLLSVAYFVAFPIEAEKLLGAAEPFARIIEKHHKMSKFVLTGCILVTSASVSVLYKYRNEKFPNWFLPNLLFISFMVVSFLGRSLAQAYRIP